MFEGYPLISEPSWTMLAIIYIGVAVLGLVMAYGLLQWRKARRERTPEEQRERREGTREMYRD